jgi:hypothetical protein
VRQPIRISTTSIAPGLELPGSSCQTGETSEASINTASQGVNEVATVRIELRQTDPLIWRQVEVPTSITLKVLQDIIQAVMGWFCADGSEGLNSLAEYAMMVLAQGPRLHCSIQSSSGP